MAYGPPPPTPAPLPLNPELKPSWEPPIWLVLIGALAWAACAEWFIFKMTEGIHIRIIIGQ